MTLWDEGYVPTAWQAILMFWAVMLLHALVNISGSKYLDFINNLAMYWIATAVLVILIVTSAIVDLKNEASFVFGHYDALVSGWPSGWAFFVGLLQAAYTLTGYGMVAAMCEEVQNPHLEIPRAMVLSVVGPGITGIIYLLPVLFVLPPVEILLAVKNGQPIGFLFKIVTGSAGGGFGLLLLLLGV
ncbi:uncharacterized protein A1O9_06676 [Exophiala aquamarina CBS 119918]|uniref:Amino acid permease/ SLC12A domain-containing protein n=1 Tax=Exophiala aquamarina CBS 119918 TaxID=1182545 RepID=A0A072PTB7_9EURO|nr:uncharacterized protein A1O9_06676 [Exophiala aquamarina CBS 119918]KEF58750.1 hypothetical protein A1O9_06676 [Exophiala aquamarina CBS 119918]